MTGRDIDLKYGADGQTIQHALVTGDAVLSLTGEAGQAGRRLQAAETIDMSLAPDGSTLTALAAKQRVQFTLPAAAGGASREINAQAFDSRGTPERGLTSGRFSGDVEYRERGAGSDRTARSATLDVALGAGLTIDEARFSRSVRFEEGTMSATAAAATYVLGPARWPSPVPNRARPGRTWSTNG